MGKVLDIAKYIVYQYEYQTGTQFENSELKLQKLMYLAQRESLCLRGKVLFETDIEGWKLGPVIPELRFYFEKDYEPLKSIESSNLSDEDMYIINNVLAQYGMYEAWFLSNMTHDEISWKNSRKGLSENDNGSNVLKISDIIEDAKKIRQYDNTFDMYIDEFDDYDEEVANV